MRFEPLKGLALRGLFSFDRARLFVVIESGLSQLLPITVIPFAKSFA